MQTLLLVFLFAASAMGQEGIPAGVGTGLLPPGLEGVTDLQGVNQKRIEAPQQSVEALKSSLGGSLVLPLLCCDFCSYFIRKEWQLLVRLPLDRHALGYSYGGVSHNTTPQRDSLWGLCSDDLRSNCSLRQVIF